jgi:Arm DNA-binding domain
MGKLNDVTIRGWIRSGERFEGRSDGEGLVLTWRKDTGSPFWKFRYRFASKPRVMNLGSYSDLPLSAARQAAKELRAKVALGHDGPARSRSARPKPSRRSRRREP